MIFDTGEEYKELSWAMNGFCKMVVNRHPSQADNFNRR